MVTHWESSRRPLYVRTIWKDGQHHVILDKTKEVQKEVSTSRRSKQCSSSQSSHRSSIKSTGCGGVTLKVSSVRVLLSGIKGFKNNLKGNRVREKSLERPKTWTQPRTSRVACKDLNKEVSFKAIQGLKSSKLNKSKIIDAEFSEEHPSLEKHESNVILDNALSEKVMIWLDLATHGRDSKQECTVTAQACNIKAKTGKEFSPVFYSENAVEHIADTSILKNTSPRQEERRNEIIVYSNEEVEIPQENFYHAITSTIISSEEYSYRDEPTEVEDGPKANHVKRQLHIFMPNLPNKSSDCDSSILSSTISVN